jgi:glutamyl-tRNA reductase
MTLFVFGINHNTAPVRVREQVAFAPEATPQALQRLLAETPLQEAAILSTCNRTEIYGYMPIEQNAEHETGEAVATWMADFHAINVADVQQHSYCRSHDAAARHMMRVASGLDSLVLGEPQILGQLKSSYSVAQEYATVSSHLNRLFHQSFTTAKQVRTQTAIGESPVSVAFAAVAMARQIFADFSQQKALLIGAGETIELVARHLREAGVKQLMVANRTLERAENLAAEFDAKAMLLSDIPEHLAQADIVISSTASQLPILGKGVVESALKQRKHRLMFMVDIAVPRDIEAEVDELDDVYLYTVDDLKHVIEEGKRSRQEAAQAAEKIIDQGIEEFLVKEKALDAVGTIREFRNKMETIRDSELEKALANLEKGQSAEQVLQRLARDLSNKMMHGPTIYLKKASVEDKEHGLQAVQDIYELNK